MRIATLISIACLLMPGLWAQNLAAGEYWIDTDPGFGQATAFTFPNSDDVAAQVENVDISGSSLGQHHIGIRSKDVNGIWGHTHVLTVLVVTDDVHPIGNSEYFVDADPGFGAATDASIGAGVDINEAVASVDIGSEPSGLVFVCFRSRNSNGSWGLTNCRTILMEQGAPGDVAAIEYFWDTDNGFGSGTSVDPGPGNDLPDHLIVADVIPTPGEHYLFMRSQDERGAWGHTHMDTVQVMPVGIDELEQLGIRVYPNPFVDQLLIEPSDASDFIVDLRDMRGRSVQSERITGRTTLEIENLASGMYQLLVILPSGTIYSTKITRR